MGRILRVLYFTDGLTVHDERFLRAMRAHGIEVHLLRQHADVSAPKGIIDHGEAATLSKLRNIDVDIIHAGPLDGPAWTASMLRHEKLVAMSWGYDILGGYSEQVKASLGAAAVLICDCKTVADKAKKTYGFRGETVCFPWGVDLDKFLPKPQIQRRGPLRVVSLRSFESKYRVDALIRAAQGLNVEVDLIGDGSERKHMESLGGSNVRFLGKIPHEAISAHLQRADVYVSTALVDGSSVSMLEAMACGLPVIVPDIPGNREWVEDGILYSPGNSEALREAIQTAMGNEKWRRGSGLRNRQVVKERANWSENVKRLIDVYWRLMS